MAEANLAADRQPALVATDVHKSFGSLEVLKGVSLTAHEGDVIAMLGASGSGKSTFLRCINLLETPNSGDVYVGGELISMKKNRRGESVPEDSKQVDRIRARLGMVFQQFNLWSHMTVLQNVIEAPIHVQRRAKDEVMETARKVLEKVGLGDRLSDYPAHLSGGQQQRAAIARALAMEPDVLLFDEPTSALDPELVGEVLRVMRLSSPMKWVSRATSPTRSSTCTKAGLKHRVHRTRCSATQHRNGSGSFWRAPTRPTRPTRRTLRSLEGARSRLKNHQGSKEHEEDSECRCGGCRHRTYRSVLCR